jgi:hypothetical protein
LLHCEAYRKAGVTPRVARGGCTDLRSPAYIRDRPLGHDPKKAQQIFLATSAARLRGDHAPATIQRTMTILPNLIAL